MDQGILKLRVAKNSGNTITELFMEGKSRVLDKFPVEKFEVDKEYPVEYREEYVESQANKKRLTIYYQGQLIYDSRPDLAQSAVAPKTIAQEQPATTKPSQLPYQEPQKASKETAQKSAKKSLGGHVEGISHQRRAVAPYNFVPLNEKVVRINCDEIPSFNSYSHKEKGFTGYISLEIESITPLYIRDADDEHDMNERRKTEEINKNLESGQKKKTYINPDFYSPGGKLSIPGSSLRGMVRNLLEIVSYSRFQFFDDKNIYFRGLADQSNLSGYYSKRMTDPLQKGVAKYKINAGYLKKEGFVYSIIPAEKTKNGKQFKRHDNDHHGLNPYRYKRLPNGNFIIRSGRKVNKEQQHKDVWEIFKPDSTVKQDDIIKLSDRSVYDYLNDKTRGAGINLIEECDEKVKEKIKDRKKNIHKNDEEYLVPCFYIINPNEKKQSDDGENEKDKRHNVALGHTALFRISYLNSILDLVYKFEDHKPLKEPSDNEDNKTPQYVDFAEAIFGRLDKDSKQNFAGRVFFEDAPLVSDSQNALLPAGHPKVLSGPKPTTFQHYLVQTNEDKQHLKHYDEDAQIRGYKMYWHKSGEDWQEKDENSVKDHPTQYTRITPVKPKQIFVGKIRFENLSEAELGALLFVLDLPDGCCHKLGMGKPLGLGSIKIKPTLFLSRRKERYENLFEEWTVNTSQLESNNDYIKTFEKYVLEKIGELDKNILWEIDRIKELRKMLDFENKPDDEKTRYMLIKNIEIQDRRKQNEFSERRVLPKPSDV